MAAVTVYGADVPPENIALPPSNSSSKSSLLPEGSNRFQEVNISWTALWRTLPNFVNDPLSSAWRQRLFSLRWFFPLFLAPLVVAAILKYADCPLTTLWPHYFILGSSIPWSLQIRRGEAMNIDIKSLIILLPLSLFAVRISWVLLRFLGLPSVQKCYTGMLAWGWYRTMQSFTLAAVVKKGYTYLNLYGQLASQGNFSSRHIISNFLGPKALQYTQVSACRLIRTPFIRDLYFPLCATSTLEPYDSHKERLLLPWTQDSLTNAYYEAKKISPTLWIDWERYHTVIIWLLFAWLYFYFFKFFSYICTEVPKHFCKTVIFIEKQVVSFLLFQTLRFFFNIFPHFIFSLPILIPWILQYPFRRILRTQTTGTQLLWSILVYCTMVMSIEYTNYKSYIYPSSDYEFQRRLLLGASETTLIGIWAVAIGAGFIWWFQEWAKNVIYWDYPQLQELTIIGFRLRWRFFKRLRRLYQYYDGFWRYNEEKRRGKRRYLNYQVGFNWSQSFAKWLILPAVFLVGTWNLLHIWYFIAALVNLWFPSAGHSKASMPDMFTRESLRGYLPMHVAVMFIFWRLGVPAIAAWIVNELFIVGKLDSARGTFVKIRPGDAETF